MTDNELIAMLAERKFALELTCSSNKDLGRMNAVERTQAENYSRRFRNADLEITFELRRRGAPVVIGDTELRLTCDALNFVMLEPGKRRAKGFLGSHAEVSESCLYAYPKRPTPIFPVKAQAVAAP